MAADATPRSFVEVAKSALAARHTGEAQEALERAETRALDVSNDPAAPGSADASAMIHSITAARAALGQGNMSEANTEVEAALAARAPATTSSAMAQPAAAAVPAPAMAAAKPAPATATIGAAPVSPTGLQAWTFSGKSTDAEQTVTGTGDNVQTIYTQ